MVFITEEALLTVYVRIEIAMMLGIAMTEASRRETHAIVIDDHRAPDNLVATVPVDIHDGIVVVALPIPGRSCLIVSPAPAFLQLVGSGINIVGHKLMTGVDATTEEDAGFATIQIGRTKEILGRTVSIAVAPCFSEVGLTRLKTLQGIVHRNVGHTCGTIDIDQILGTLVHKPVGAAAGGSTIVLRAVANDVSLAVGSMDGGTVGSTEQSLCLPVKIPVVAHNVLLIVLEVAHIRTAVDPPQHGAVQLQALKNAVLAIMTATRVTGIYLALVVVLQQDFHLPVTIDVSTTRIVGYQRRGDRRVVLGRYLQIAIGPRRCRFTHRLLHATFHSFHSIAAGHGTCCISVVGGGQLLSHRQTVAIEVVGDIIVLVRLNAPTDEDSFRSLHSHYATIQLVNHALSIGCYTYHAHRQGQ